MWLNRMRTSVFQSMLGPNCKAIDFEGEIDSAIDNRNISQLCDLHRTLVSESFPNIPSKLAQRLQYRLEEAIGAISEQSLKNTWAAEEII